MRFGGCDLRCRWCDSPRTWHPARECRIEIEPGSGRFRVEPNPLALETVLAAAKSLGARHHAVVSLTGGEPLLQPDVVGALAPAMRALGPRVLLETHGALPDALGQVVSAIDIVSMDWKLASDVRRATDPPRGAVPGFEAEHERSLAVARGSGETVVKIVVTPASEDAEIDVAIACIARTHPEACLVLQPVTPGGGVTEGVPAGRLLGLVERASRRLAHVRVIPQTHTVLGLP